jgi:hypothetical protein
MKESPSAAPDPIEEGDRVTAGVHVRVIAIRAARARVVPGSVRVALALEAVVPGATVQEVRVLGAIEGLVRVDQAVLGAPMSADFAGMIAARISRRSSRRRCALISCRSLRLYPPSRSRFALRIARSRFLARAAFSSSVPSGIALALLR